MLISRAEIEPGHYVDVRIEEDRIAAIGSLAANPDEAVIEAGGAALLPGLHDHHLHFLAFASALGSLRCGPPDVHSERDLVQALTEAELPPGGDWLRGIGYHESVAGHIDRAWLDRHLPTTPVRVQHRTGRLWVVNTAGLECLLARAPGLPDENPELSRACVDGRFYDQDLRLRPLWSGGRPDIGAASRKLARLGVTGFTDMTPANDSKIAQMFAALQHSGAVLQSVLLAGQPGLNVPEHERLLIGPTKVHLHETNLPDFDDLCRLIRSSHAGLRPVAVHCVTEAELVYSLAAFRESGTLVGDRLEHASVAPDALLDEIADLKLLVVTQPNFVAERGDAYLAEVSAADHGSLYRGSGFLSWGIPLAGGTDAPFGDADPWLAMRAAVDRQTEQGAILCGAERLTPEQAVALFLGAAQTPDRPRCLHPGATADLCLLDQPWRRARLQLSSRRVSATLCRGRIVYQRVDQTPGQGLGC